MICARMLEAGLIPVNTLPLALTILSDPAREPVYLPVNEVAPEFQVFHVVAALAAVPRAIVCLVEWRAFLR